MRVQAGKSGAHLQAELEQGQGAACKVAHHLQHMAAPRKAPMQRARLRSDMHMEQSTGATAMREDWNARVGSQRQCTCERPPPTPRATAACATLSPEHLASSHLRDAEAAGGAPLVVEQHLRHILGQRHRDLYHAQVVQEPAPPGARRSAPGVAQDPDNCSELLCAAPCSAKPRRMAEKRALGSLSPRHATGRCPVASRVRTDMTDTLSWDALL